MNILIKPSLTFLKNIYQFIYSKFFNNFFVFTRLVLENKNFLYFNN